MCSWGEYIDESLIGEFEAQTGIHVNYQTAESNETLYSLLQTGGADFDVIVPSDYMIGRLIDEGMLAELDYSAIPNYDLIDPQYKSLSFDPENKYTVPYSWGTVGIIYNTKMVDEPITSWGAMFDEKYAGQVLMINNSRDALMAALCYLGYDINTTDEGQLTEAFELVKNAKDKGVYQAFVMDEIFGKMEGGNAAIAMYYAGDYLTMLENNEDLAFVVPEEGSNWFVDAMCVLKSSQHKDEAMEWINFIAGTDASLANMDYIWYASPNAEVELIDVTTRALLNIGFTGFTVNINDRRILRGMLESMGFAADTLDSVCITFDKMDKIGADGVKAELTEKGFAAEAVQALDDFLRAGDFSLDTVAARVDDEALTADLRYVIAASEKVAGGRYGIAYAPSLVRGQGYYTGMVFEVTCPQFSGAVAGGGRYDNMVGKFIGQQVPAVGFSIGFERVCGILLEQGYQIPGAKPKMALLYLKDADFAAVLAKAESLRADYDVTVLPQAKKLGKQFGTLEAAGYNAVAFADNDDVKLLGRKAE